MSLINQMLRDLQQQKEAAGKPAPKPLRPKRPERIPVLPLPLVLGAAGLLLLLVVWWLAGALAVLMFGDKPADRPQTAQLLVAGEPLPAVAERDQLSPAERQAEPPPVAPATPAAQMAKAAEPAKVPAVQKTAPAQSPVVKKAPAPVRAAAPAAAGPKPETPPSRPAARAAKPAMTAPAPTPREPAAVAPRRVHPDDLPGAVRSSARIEPPPQEIARPSRLPASTPYGMAEEAFLDGRWALEQGRENMAVRSLQHALELYPGHLPARKLLVEILTRSGKSGEALFLLAEGLEIAPDYIDFKKSYARLLADQGDFDAATKAMLNGGLPTVEADPEAHVVMATLYQRLGEPFLAAQTYRNLLVAWPQTGAFWVGLGSALEAQNLPAEAMECYRRALATKNLRQDLNRFAQKRLELLD